MIEQTKNVLKKGILGASLEHSYSILSVICILLFSYKGLGIIVQVYFLGIEENRRVAREHFQSRMRIFTRTKVAPRKDNDTPGDTIITFTPNNISELGLNHKARRYGSGTVGHLDSGILASEDSQYSPSGGCNLNIPDGGVSG